MSEKISSIGDLLLGTWKPSALPPADMCGCSICGWKGRVSDCETTWESEGWEYPEYLVHLCPVCEDGGNVDDYWGYPEQRAEMEVGFAY